MQPASDLRARPHTKLQSPISCTVPRPPAEILRTEPRGPMALTEEELAPWHLRIANFERVIGRSATSPSRTAGRSATGSWARTTPVMPTITAPTLATMPGASAPCSSTSTAPFTCSAARSISLSPGDSWTSIQSCAQPGASTCTTLRTSRPITSTIWQSSIRRIPTKMQRTTAHQ